MDQNQTIDNDLQKAIDDITNTTNSDPVFSDPVAAPSSVPEGEAEQMSEPVGPFPEPKVEMVPPATEPIAPLEAANIPAFNDPNLMPNDQTENISSTISTPESQPTQTLEPGINQEPTIEKTEIEPIPGNHSIDQIKKAALRDLIPLLDKVNMDTSKKFKLYKNIFEDLKDYTVFEPAYTAARAIPDETERAEALLYLVDAIDKM